MLVNLKPIRFPQANAYTKGRHIDPLYRDLSLSSRIEGCHYFFDGRQYVSIWRCSNIWSRIVFLFTGKINVIELGSLRPRALSIGHAFEKQELVE